MKKGSLTVVGTGLKSIAHMTAEAVAAIRTADKVLYGTCEPLTESWIQDNAKDAESIDGFYVNGEPRIAAYRGMIDKVMSEVRSGRDVCLSFEGHPGIFVYVSHESIRQARSEGYRARMQPGVSTQSALFCDLLIDPAADGCQSFDATDFLLRSYEPDVTSLLILWQVGCIGDLRFRETSPFGKNVDVLVETLAGFYGGDHQVYVYQAPLFVLNQPQIIPTAIRDLASHHLGLATLCVPPLREVTTRADLVREFGLEAS